MRKNQLNEGLNHIDAEIVEGYLKQKDRLNQKRKTRSAGLRFAVIAACFVLIISGSESDAGTLPVSVTPSSPVRDHLMKYSSFGSDFTP